MTNTPKFVHLKVHTDYSMIDGLSSPLNIIKKIKSLNMPSVGITDYNNLFGVIKFYNLAHSFGIKPIIGIDVNVYDVICKDALSIITLLAMNYDGYRNLVKLISKSYEYRAKHKKVFIKKKWLANNNNGLIVLSGGCYGDLGKGLLDNNYKLVKECLFFYRECFPNTYYLEIMRTGRLNEEIYLKKVLKIAVKNKIPLVVTNDVRFLNQEDFEAHQIRIAINRGLNINSINKFCQYSKQQFLRSEKEMCMLFQDIPQGLINSVEIAKRCNVILSFKKHFLPSFNTGLVSPEEFLIKKSVQGLKNRLKRIFHNKTFRKKISLKYKNRLLLELKVINKMGFASYFLIIMEFIQWAKKNNIPVGPGRGSGAGSLVAYSLCITELDPLEFDLLFERFLNPERINLPDFDIDFCMEQRDRVIEHVSNLYGNDSVVQIITFGTMTAKAVIKDVGRVLGYRYSFINNISKLIPMDPGITLEMAFSNHPDLINYYNQDEGIKLLVDTAKKLEGIVRNIGKHAGGLVISPSIITDYSPLYSDDEGKNVITQFDKNDIEKIGLVKFDFLGLRTLTIIKRTVNIINKKFLSSQSKKIDINAIFLNDVNVFKELKKANTTAIFQLESFGMKDLINRLQPDNFEDLIALVALFRPGPLQSGMVDNFINRKHGREKIYYPDKNWGHELLKPILKSTYGIILYQEQVMKIAQVLAGYTLGKADILRRAMSKKDPIKMAEQRSVFKLGAKKLGVNERLSVKIFDLLEKFAGYGFNKSHSAAYAFLSYQTLWLKYYYPNIFMASVMTSEIHNIDKIIILWDECLKMDIKVIPPDINSSSYEFVPIKNKTILYGMGAIKGVGKFTINSIVNIRNKGNKFCNLFDLCVRTAFMKLTHKIIEKLIMSGACDCFKEKRSVLFIMVHDTIKASKQYLSNQFNKQKNLFGDIIHQYKDIFSQKSINVEEWSEKEKFLKEKKVLGFYLTGHPINQYLKELVHYTGGLRLNEINTNYISKVITVFGSILSVKFRLTKNRKMIAILILDDNSKKLEAIIFSDLINQFRSRLVEDKILILKGKLFFDKFKNKIIMSIINIIDIESVRKKYLSKIILKIESNDLNKNFFIVFQKLLNKYKTGNVPIFIQYNKLSVKSILRLDSKWNIVPTNSFLDELKQIVGTGKIFFKLKKIKDIFLFMKS